MRFCLSLIVVALALATALPAENWPAFRGPTGTGVTFSNLVYNAGSSVGTSSIDEIRLGGTFAAVTPPATAQATVPAVQVATAAEPFQNPVNPLDVLGTGGAVTPADALAVINYLNTHPGGALPTSATGLTEYLDVQGTGTVVPQDALEIIDYLNTHPAGAPATPAVAPAVTSDLITASSASALVRMVSASMDAVPATENAAVALSNSRRLRKVLGTLVHHSHWQ